MRTLNMFQGSNEWHAERSRRFTASEAPAMMGALYEAADLIGEVTDAEGRARLTAYFEERQFALESA